MPSVVVRKPRLIDRGRLKSVRALSRVLQSLALACVSRGQKKTSKIPCAVADMRYLIKRNILKAKYNDGKNFIRDLWPQNVDNRRFQEIHSLDPNSVKDMYRPLEFPLGNESAEKKNEKACERSSLEKVIVFRIL